MRFLRLAAALGMLALGMLAVAVAPAGAQQSGSDPISRLERIRKSSPGSVGALRALGMAYYRAGRYPEARSVLEQAQHIAPRDGLVALYLGMSAELMEDLPAARKAYTQYVSFGHTGRTRAQLRTRLAALNRKELALAARQAVANEGKLAGEPPSPTTIAVLPLRFTGTDSSLMPLERGLADLLVTDLSRSATLTVVERDRMQALVDEMKLSQSGGVDSTTTVRSGRMLRAGRVVQGGITELPGRSVSVTAAVIDVPTTLALKSVQSDDRLEQLFNLEKKIVFNLFDALDVRLTAQERVLVEQRPTHSLAAFLAYSAGLMAEDNGNLDEAARFFGEAARIDPGFAAAAQRRDNAEAAQSGQAVTTATLEATLNGGFEGSVVNAANRGVAIDNFNSLSGTINNVINDLNPSLATQVESETPVTPPSARDPASSATGTDNIIANTGRISIVVKQPGIPK